MKDNQLTEQYLKENHRKLFAHYDIIYAQSANKAEVSLVDGLQYI